MNISLEAIGTEPVTTSEAKTYMGVDTADHDTLIGEKITEAREWFEDLTGRLVEQRAVTVEFDSWEATSPIRLPYGPAVEITTVKEFSEAGVKGSAIANTNYLLVRLDPPLLESDGNGWQLNKSRQALEIVYEGGGPVGMRAKSIILEYINRAYDAAGSVFDTADLELRAVPLTIYPLGVAL